MSVEDLQRRVDINQDGELSLGEYRKFFDREENMQVLREEMSNPEVVDQFISKIDFRALLSSQFSRGDDIYDKSIDFIESVGNQNLSSKEILDGLKILFGGTLQEIDTYRDIRVLEAFINTQYDGSEPLQIEQAINTSQEVMMTREDIQRQQQLAQYSYLNLDPESFELVEREFNPDFDLRGILMAQQGEGNIQQPGNYHGMLMQQALTNILENDIQIQNLPDVDIKDVDGELVLLDESFSREQRDQINQVLASLNDVDINTGIQVVSLDVKGLLESLPERGEQSWEITKEVIIEILKITKHMMDTFKNVFNRSGNQELLDEMNEEYEILGYYEDKETGFAATLVKDENTGEKSVLLRGSDDVFDWLVNDSLIFASMLVSREYVMPQIASLNDFVQEMKDSGLIQQGERVNVVGHSLGGTLTEFMELNHGEMVNRGYNILGPGSQEMLGREVVGGEGSRIVKVNNEDFISNINTSIAQYVVPVDGRAHGIADLGESLEGMREGNMIVIDKLRMGNI